MSVRKPWCAGAAAAIVLAFLTAPAADVGCAQTSPQFNMGTVDGLRLRFVILNAASPPATPIVTEETELERERELVWRHTFGAERRTTAMHRKEAIRHPLRINADVALLHGVKNVNSVRQMLPARDYHLLVSRQILRRGKAQMATTAIAVRRSSGLRVVAQDHLLQLAEASADSSVPLAAGTAARLLGPNGSLWVLALDLAQCSAEMPEDAACDAARRQLAAVEDWATERIEEGEPLIIGGRLHTALTETSLPGRLGKLLRFPGIEPAGRDCATDDGLMDLAYVLASPGFRLDQIRLDGGFEQVNENAPESGCLMTVEANLRSSWTQTIIRAAHH